MITKLIVIIGLIVAVLLLAGCFDTSGYNECFDSYDNLVLIKGYKIYGHRSDFVCCADYTYFVSYHIGHPNATVELWIHGFIYHSDTDELYYEKDSYYVKEIINYNR